MTFARITRRELIALAGATALSNPARAQQAPLPVIGYLTLGSAMGGENSSAAAFRKGLSEMGYTDGRNVAIEYYFAENEFKRLPAWATDLVRRRAAVIVAQGNAAAFAAKAATSTIPIVFGTGGDPVQTGLVASLNRPGGNVTGVTNLAAEVGAKRLGLLSDLLPGAARFGLLVNPTSPNADFLIKEAEAAVAGTGRRIEVLTASSSREIDAAFANVAEKKFDGLVINGNTLFNNRRVQVVTWAAHHRLPAIYDSRIDAEIGGLMSYGPNSADLFRKTGVYAGRILKGEKVADLPVERATQFEFIINMQTARVLGLTVPPMLLALATEIIE
jgi:putative ABC transport system substrate-binding protein